MKKPRVWNFKDPDLPQDAVSICRGTPYGNRFVIGQHGNRTEVINKFIKHQLPELRDKGLLEALRGKHLVCYCAPKACHGDILLAEAN